MTGEYQPSEVLGYNLPKEATMPHEAKILYPDDGSLIPTADEALDKAYEIVEDDPDDLWDSRVFVYKAEKGDQKGYILTDDYASGQMVNGMQVQLYTIVEPEEDEED